MIRAKNGPQQRKELAVLQIEKQAVVQVLIKELASQLDVDQDSSLKIRRVCSLSLVFGVCIYSTYITLYLLQLIGAASWQYINNNLLGNECMGGGVAEGHGLMLALHHIRKFKNFKDFQCLMVQRFHSLSQDIYCLKPLHKKVAVSTIMLVSLSTLEVIINLFFRKLRWERCISYIVFQRN